MLTVCSLSFEYLKQLVVIMTIPVIRYFLDPSKYLLYIWYINNPIVR